jgi:DNA-binding MarR family transcriptional regulator
MTTYIESGELEVTQDQKRRARPPTVREEIKQSRPFRSRSQEAYLALLRTADESRRHAGQALESAGITLQQYNVLRILRGAGDQGLPTLSVAERMLERTPGVTRLIDRMERKELVTRERCTDDRRRVWCRITRRGLDLLDELDAPIQEVDDAPAAVLDEAELVQLIEYLDRLRAHFARSS